MIGEYINAIFKWLGRVISQPREELNRWQMAVRFAYDLGRFGARQLRHDRAPHMAAALAFRALFGLVPVMVVATVLVGAVVDLPEFLSAIDGVVAWVGLDQIRIVDGESTRTLAQWLRNLTRDAAGIRLGAIGWVGLAVLSYAAVSLLSTIENVFNIIYRVSDGRPWTRRVPLYWFLLTASPIAFGLGAWLNGRVETWLLAIDAWPWALGTARLLWTGLVGWIVIWSVYVLLPNAQVKFRPAAIGALVTVILFEVGKRVLGSTLENAFLINQLYGSLGLIPLFMFWVYLMWLAVLFGLQVSAILQMLHGRRLEEIEHRRELTGLIEPASVITVMERIAARFAAGRSSTADEISDDLALPRSTVATMLDYLVEAGLLHRLERDSAAVSLALPAEQISAAQLIDVGFAMLDDGGARTSNFLERLRTVQRDLAGDRTLANLVSPPTV